MSASADFMTSMSPYLSGANTGLNIYRGATSGNTAGQVGAGLSAAKAAGKLSGNVGLNAGATGALDALNIYQGLEQGGAQGYGRAAGSGLQLAGLATNNPMLSTIGGGILAPLAVYNAVENYQSGKTGSDALQGASAGAAVGSIIPGIGTVIGGLVGGAVGALASAFGPGAKDPETSVAQGLIDYTGSHGNTQAAAQNVPNPYLELAGLMDRRSSTLPMYQQYGRMGEQKFTNDMAAQINDAFTNGIQSGPMAGNKWSVDPSTGNYVLTTPTGGKTIYNPKDAAAEVYNSTVSPWVNNMGSGYSNVGDTYNATTQGLLQDMTSQYLSGQAGNSWKAIGGDSPFANIYNGSPFQAAAAAPAQTPSAGNSNTQASQGGMKLAGGGAVDKRMQAVLRGSFRKRHYDDGGTVSYFGDSGYTPPSTDYSSFTDPTLTDFGAPGTGATDLSNPYSDINLAGLNNNSYVNASNDPYAYSSGSSGGSSSSPYAALGSLLSGLGLSGSSLAPYAALAPLLASALGIGKGGANAPSVPSQYSGPLMNMQTPPAFNRQQNPTNMSQQQWLHAAENGPEINYYSGNQLPITPMSAPNAASMTSAPAGTPNTPYTGSQTNPYSVVPTTGTNGNNILQQIGARVMPGNMQAMPIGMDGSGVRPTMMAHGGLAYGVGGPTSVDSTGSGLGGLGHVKGPGDGTSDSIKLQNAYLSNGEYVIDAPTVSMAGNGSNDAGAKVFDRIRSDIRKHGGKALAKGKQPMTAKQVNVANYMGGGR